MFGLSFGHLLILAVVVLLFGGRRLPELGSALGRGLRAFKNGLEGGESSSDSVTPSFSGRSNTKEQLVDQKDRQQS